MLENRKLLITGAVFFVLLLFSVIAFSIDKFGSTTRVLFFPDKQSGKLIPEERYVKKGTNHIQSIRFFLDELLLGPSKSERTRLFPDGTTLLSVVKYKKKLDINFSYVLLKPDDKLSLSLYKILQSVVNNVLFNFGDINEIKFYINGYPLDSEKVDDEGKTVFIYENRYKKELLK